MSGVAQRLTANVLSAFGSLGCGGHLVVAEEREVLAKRIVKGGGIHGDSSQVFGSWLDHEHATARAHVVKIFDPPMT